MICLAPRAVSVYPTPSNSARKSSGVTSARHSGAPPVPAPNFEAGTCLSQVIAAYSPQTFVAATSATLDTIVDPHSDDSETEPGKHLSRI